VSFRLLYNKILTSTTFIIECISWSINVTVVTFEHFLGTVTITSFISGQWLSSHIKCPSFTHFLQLIHRSSYELLPYICYLCSPTFRASAVRRLFILS